MQIKGIFCRRKDDEPPIVHCRQCKKHGKMEIKKRVRKTHILFEE